VDVRTGDTDRTGNVACMRSVSDGGCHVTMRDASFLTGNSFEEADRPARPPARALTENEEARDIIDGAMVAAPSVVRRDVENEAALDIIEGAKVLEEFIPSNGMNEEALDMVAGIWDEYGLDTAGRTTSVVMSAGSLHEYALDTP